MTDGRKIRIAAIVGCTASGKTALSVELAHIFGGEIVSCDSMQIYRGMNIGTAKPTENEKRGIRHHMIDIAAPDSAYSCADYARGADVCIRDISSCGKLPIFCGGTGLYLDGLLRGGTFEQTDTDDAFRLECEKFARENGNKALHAKLFAIDAESAAVIHPNNIKRVIRALEIFHTTGKTKSELDRISREPESRYNATVIGIRYNDRELLYDRINRRVDLMINEGLADETKRLYDAGIFGRNATAAQAIGYKELLPYIKGEAALDEAVVNLKTATRRYAKRQMTWFYAKPYITWVDADCNGQQKSFEEIVNNATDILRINGF